MTPTWWLLETEIIKRKEGRRASEIEDIFKGSATLLKSTLVSVLGLNLVPEEDENGLLKMPDPDKFIPMSVMTARSDFLNHALEKVEKFEQQLKGLNSSSSEENIEEDLMFMDDIDQDVFKGKSDKEIEWESVEVQKTLDQLVIRDDSFSPDIELKDSSSKVLDNTAEIKKSHIQFDKVEKE